MGFASFQIPARPTAAMITFLMLSLLCAAPMSPARAADVQKVKTYTVFGEHLEDSQDGCRHSYVGIYASHETGPDAFSVNYLELVHNSCTGTYETDKSGSWQDAHSVPTLDVSGSLSTARLTATIDVHDWLTDTWETMEIDETFTGYGSVVKDRERLPDQAEQQSSRFKYASSSRHAVGSGTVTLDDAWITKFTTKS